MQTHPESNHFDALIVGARCAGAATAMLLARAGLNVLLIDRDAAGSDTMSTHALMRGAVMQLDRWGLLEELLAGGVPPVRRTTFHYGSQTLPLDIRPGHGVGILMAPRRAVLDAQLVAAARRAGAVVRHRTALREVTFDPETGRVSGAVLSDPRGKTYRVSAGITIGADGRRSSVARQVGARTMLESTHLTGCVYGYFGGLEDNGYRWYYGHNAAAGAIPTNAGAHCVFAAVSAEEFRILKAGHQPADLLALLAERTNPELRALLDGAEALSHPIMFAGAPGHVRHSHGPGWALVGDAGYFKDPLTAHGITDALRDAEILADAVIRGTADALAGYQDTRDRLSRGLFGITDRIASFDWSLQELQRLHKQLNGEMKNEQTWMAETFAPGFLAA
ncbi:NAD(P)/FAD-dependent oxidoreductase [Tropicimonas sediminicola]|uniref:Dehydrogenase (Flavoprotein) n=1 Tax=Tropicimonas sediminicola TaxID=1031541 RepID=A0A239FWW4_9RHOB|nr:FAD-dependent monooxygenase [Tropicimonas sediminicola]SNS60314.1 Dehydrogenase (flavoprotein) [Tropicimonas sediminicola]